MFDNLEKLIRDNAQDLVVNNSAIPNEQNENVLSAASGSIVDTLKAQFANGNATDLIKSFMKNGADVNSLTGEATDNFTQRLGALGINMDTAKTLGASLIPILMKKFTSSGSGADGAGFNIQDILGKLAAGADGKFDMNDIKDMFSGKKDGAKGDAGGGFLDKLKDMF